METPFGALVSHPKREFTASRSTKEIRNVEARRNLGYRGWNYWLGRR